MIKLIIAPSDRKVLHGIIAERFMSMMEQGFIAEVERLFQRGDLNETLPSIRAVGYRQAWSYLQGDINKATLIETAIIATRQLAKRQFTWLRKESDTLCFETGQTDLLTQVLAALAKITPTGLPIS
jgi:tRNA dimethylallyltransferase